MRLARSEYEIAERALDLEIRKQYPDLTVGGGFGTDQGDERVLGGLNLPLPLWNQNRRSIAEARASREAMRVAAEAEFDRLSAEVAKAQVDLDAATVRLVFVETELAPLVDEQLAAARKLERLGNYNTLILLESIKASYDAKVEVVQARLKLAQNELASWGVGGRGCGRRRWKGCATMKRSLVTSTVLATALAVGSGCDKPGNTDTAAPTTTREEAKPPSNRIDLPETVRQNLGITFAKVERRRVASTIRVPGRFELLPTARREYRATCRAGCSCSSTSTTRWRRASRSSGWTRPSGTGCGSNCTRARSAIETATAELAVAERNKGRGRNGGQDVGAADRGAGRRRGASRRARDGADDAPGRHPAAGGGDRGEAGGAQRGEARLRTGDRHRRVAARRQPRSS